ncbi:MAG: hypothetical protein ACYTBJ_05840 [Planctomycetota bacterium]|jgi:hypothetical protein
MAKVELSTLQNINEWACFAFSAKPGCWFKDLGETGHPVLLKADKASPHPGFTVRTRASKERLGGLQSEYARAWRIGPEGVSCGFRGRSKTAFNLACFLVER